MTAINLFCGDCLDVMRGIEDNSIDAIITDPPYGILKHKIETSVDIPVFFAECKRVLKPNSFILFFGRQPTLSFWNTEAFQLFKYKTEIIWYKRHRTSPMDDIGRMFENITVCTKGTRSFNKVYRNFCDVKQSLAEFTELETIKGYFSDMQTIFNNKVQYEEAMDYIHAIDKSIFYIEGYTTGNDDATFSKSVTKRPKVLNNKVRAIVKGLLPQNLISFISHNNLKYDMSGEGKGEFNIKHPTVKPIALMEYLVELTRKEGDVILDLFMGSGTTGIACRNLNRQFIGVEIDKEYFAIAEARITGESTEHNEPATTTEVEVVENVVKPTTKQLQLI